AANPKGRGARTEGRPGRGSNSARPCGLAGTLRQPGRVECAGEPRVSGRGFNWNYREYAEPLRRTCPRSGWGVVRESTLARVGFAEPLLPSRRGSTEHVLHPGVRRYSKGGG